MSRLAQYDKCWQRLCPPRDAPLEAARRGDDVDKERVHLARVVEYDVPERRWHSTVDKSLA